MRSSIPALLIALLATSALGAPAADAAPICQTENGGAIKCGSPGAMPLGWIMPAEQRERLRAAQPPAPTAGEILPGLLFVATFIAMFALLPEFDGTKDSDWEPGKGHKRRRR